MTNLTNYLCYELIMIIFDLLPDRDKIQFSMANKYLASFVPKIIWTDLHKYEKVRFLSYKNNFRKLSFKPRYDIIPPIITHLIIDKKFVGSLTNAIPKSVKKIYIDKDSRLKHVADIPTNIEIFCKCVFNKKYYPNKVLSLVSSCCFSSYKRITIRHGDFYSISNFYDTSLCTEMFDYYIKNNNTITRNYEGIVFRKRDSKYINLKTALALAILTSPKPIAQTERLCPDIQSIEKPKSKLEQNKIHHPNIRQKLPKHIIMPKQKFSKYHR
nr:hypothetical protein [Megavirus caiporensis]